MIPHVLGIGYPCEEYLKTSVGWAMYGLEFDYVDDIKHAIVMLLFKEYVCIVICADTIFQEDLDALRKIRPVPIVVVPPSYTEDERFACVHFGAAQYLRTIDYPPMIPDVTNSNSLQNCLKLTQDQRKPLTIITVQDLSICMESRSVEIKGKEIKLTETEFDILSLLVMNQKQVFTYEMIMESVWESDYEFYSRNAISSHISNLRRKLQASSDVAEHMQNALFADAVAGALRRFDSDFDPVMSESPDKVLSLCDAVLANVLIMEVTAYTPWKFEERMKIRDELRKINPDCKIVLVVDENTEKKLADKVRQAKKDGLIDNFIYGSVSAAYLSAVIDTL